MMGGPSQLLSVSCRVEVPHVREVFVIEEEDTCLLETTDDVRACESFRASAGKEPAVFFGRLEYVVGRKSNVHTWGNLAWLFGYRF
jgi:hypothetical protein